MFVGYVLLLLVIWFAYARCTVSIVVGFRWLRFCLDVGLTLDLFGIYVNLVE